MIFGFGNDFGQNDCAIHHKHENFFIGNGVYSWLDKSGVIFDKRIYIICHNVTGINLFKVTLGTGYKYPRG